MNWTKPLTHRTLFQTSKTKIKEKSRRPGSDQEEGESVCERVSTCVQLRQSLRKQTTNEVARRELDGKAMQKQSLQGLVPGRETPAFFFLTAHM